MNIGDWTRPIDISPQNFRIFLGIKILTKLFRESFLYTRSVYKEQATFWRFASIYC